MISAIIILLSYLLEITLNHYLPSTYNYLYSMFFITSLITYIIINYKKEKTLYFIIGCCLIYD